MLRQAGSVSGLACVRPCQYNSYLWPEGWQQSRAGNRPIPSALQSEAACLETPPCCALLVGFSAGFPWRPRDLFPLFPTSPR